MNNFSLLEEALGIAQSYPLDDLGPVTYVSRDDFYERETFTFRAGAPCLEYLSLMIENAVLLRTNRAGRVYAGFERLSRMEGICDRYMRIADVSERVYVFGEADWTPPRHPNMRAVQLKHDSRLAREWFVIANSTTLRLALVAADEAEDGRTHPPEARRLRALKTSNPSIIARLTTMIEDLVNVTLAA